MEPYVKKLGDDSWEISTGNHMLKCNDAGKEMFDKALQESVNDLNLTGIGDGNVTGSYSGSSGYSGKTLSKHSTDPKHKRKVKLKTRLKNKNARKQRKRNR